MDSVIDASEKIVVNADIVKINPNLEDPQNLGKNVSKDDVKICLFIINFGSDRSSRSHNVFRPAQVC